MNEMVHVDAGSSSALLPQQMYQVSTKTVCPGWISRLPLDVRWYHSPECEAHDDWNKTTKNNRK